MRERLWDRLHVRRERHRQRHFVVRTCALGAGAVLAFLGLLLLFALPEVGAPILLVGLSMLALKFDSAGRAHVRAHLVVAAGRGWLLARPSPVRIALLALPALTVSASLLFAFPFSPLA